LRRFSHFCVRMARRLPLNAGRVGAPSRPHASLCGHRRRFQAPPLLLPRPRHPLRRNRHPRLLRRARSRRPHLRLRGPHSFPPPPRVDFVSSGLVLEPSPWGSASGRCTTSACLRSRCPSAFFTIFRPFCSLFSPRSSRPPSLLSSSVAPAAPDSVPDPSSSQA